MILPRHRHYVVPQEWAPTLLVVIDTEEEFNWHKPFDPAATSVRNIAEQPRAQAIFDRFGIVPTYVVDYPVAATPQSANLLAGFAAERRCAIGAHLHPWVTPPHQGPIDTYHSYAGNLSPELERAKLASLTQAIAANMGVQPVIYKAGRYGVGPATPGILADLGYQIDCSLVPYTNFAADGGPDFTDYADTPFDIQPGLLELPLSVGFAGHLAAFGGALFPKLHSRPGLALRLPGIAARLGLLERLRLSPEGHTLSDMIRQTHAGMAAGKRLFMLTYHSSSLLPGAAPYVADIASRDSFLQCIENFCRFFVQDLGGMAGTPQEVAIRMAAPLSLDQAA
jgi:hypothetical protein